MRRMMPSRLVGTREIEPERERGRVNGGGRRIEERNREESST